MSFKGFGNGGGGGNTRTGIGNAVFDPRNIVRGPINGPCKDNGGMASYFRAYQSPQNGGELDPVEGFVFYSANVQTGAVANAVKKIPPIQVPPGFYLLVQSTGLSSDAAVAADIPANAVYISPNADFNARVGVGSNGFIEVTDPSTQLGAAGAAGSILTGVSQGPWIGIVPSNFFVTILVATGTGVDVRVRATIAGILLADQQNGDVKQVL